MGEDPFLVLVSSHEPHAADLGRKYRLTTAGMTMHRSAEATVSLPQAPTPCFLKFEHEGSDWCVRDLASSNQALLNGIPFEIGYLSDGDLIQLGKYVFEFCLAKGVKAQFYEEIYASLTEDILTRAYNRKFLLNLLEWELLRYKICEANRRSSTNSAPPPMLSLIMFDLDDFGQINKRYDHQVGDLVLKKVVRCVKERVRATDIVARLGGEEFVIYLPDTPVDQAWIVAEQVRSCVAEEAISLEGIADPLRVTISSGIACLQPGMDVPAFLRIANHNMLAAKRQGKNRVVV